MLTHRHASHKTGLFSANFHNFNSLRITKIVHIITGLTRGGAEKMLQKLLMAMDKERFHNEVISLRDKNIIGGELSSAGFSVHELRMFRAYSAFLAVFRLKRLLEKLKPTVVQTWLYHADLIGGLASIFAGQHRVAWNVRNSTLVPASTKRHTLFTIKACSQLSAHVPRRIIFCSEASRRSHVESGYCSNKTEVIPNGIDLSMWKKECAAGAQLRSSHGFPTGSILIGHLARFHPQKDHAGFIRAATAAYRENPALRFVLAGEGVDWNNSTLASPIQSAGVTEAFRLLGPRDDIRHILSSVDALCLSSAFGEAFPNVLIEAMACNLPCVTTDVGDSAYIVGGSGIVVPPGDEFALTSALLDLSRMSVDKRVSNGNIGRNRASELFDIRSIVQKYEALYSDLAR